MASSTIAAAVAKGERKLIPLPYNPKECESWFVIPSPVVKTKKLEPGPIMSIFKLSFRCNKCETEFYKGTRISYWLKDVTHKQYAGFQITKIRLKCMKCSAKIILKTNPRTWLYEVRSGATQIPTPWKDEDKDAGKRVQRKLYRLRSMEGRTHYEEEDMRIPFIKRQKAFEKGKNL